MRLVFMFENYVVGGSSKYIIDCINSIFTITNDVHIISNRDAFSIDEIKSFKLPVKRTEIQILERKTIAETLFRSEKNIDNCRKFLLFFNPLFLIINMIKIFFILKKVNPSIVISCNGGYPGAESTLSATLAARLLKIPSLLIVLSQPKKRRLLIFFYDQILDYLVFKSVKFIVANSVNQLKILEMNRSAPKNKLLLIHNGLVDTINIKKNHRYGDVKKHILGVVCRLEKDKGLEFLIESIAILKNANYLIELYIIGEGGFREYLTQQITDLDLGSIVKLFGYVKGDLDAIIEQFNIYVFPSLFEGLPYSILEGLRAGLPIVATGVGGIPEVIRDGIDGIIVQPRSSLQLAEAISRLIDNKDFALTLSKNARARYENLFTLEKMQTEFATIVRGLQ